MKNVSNLKQYATDLWAVPTASLPKGLRRERGQLRNEHNHRICAVSGRSHIYYLLEHEFRVQVVDENGDVSWQWVVNCIDKDEWDKIHSDDRSGFLNVVRGLTRRLIDNGIDAVFDR